MYPIIPGGANHLRIVSIHNHRLRLIRVIAGSLPNKFGT